MNKEELLQLGLTEEQANKVLENNTEQLKGFIPKARFGEVNNANKNLTEKHNNELSKIKLDNAIEIALKCKKYNCIKIRVKEVKMKRKIK